MRTKSEKSEFDRYKESMIKIAHQLLYSDEVIERIICAQNVTQVENAMALGRKNL